MAQNDMQTKHKLIKSAKKLFAKYNYDYVSTRKIANDAGVGQSAIFFHFGSKEKLAEEVINDILTYHIKYYADLVTETEELLQQKELSEEAISALLRKYIDVQIDIAFNTANDAALPFSFTTKSMPNELTQPIAQSNMDNVELPMAKLLCAKCHSVNISKAIIITHSINASIVAYRYTGSSQLLTLAGIGNADNTQRIQLADFLTTSLLNATL